METDVLRLIENQMDEFSKGQKTIARYMLQHYETAAYMTASRLGTAVGVSESTVVRFADQLGFDGYPALQKSLQELIRARLTSLQRIEAANFRIGDGSVPEKILTSDMEKIRYTLEHLDTAVFDATIATILHAKRIYIMGVRSSSALASFLYFYFNMIFEDVKLLQTTSRSEVFEQIFRAKQGDLFIGISFPRYSQRVVAAMQYAREHGAQTLAITDNTLSPLIEFANYTLTAKSDMASFVDSLVAPLSLLNALIVAVTRQKAEEVATVFSTLEGMWERFDVYEKKENDAEK